MAVHRPSKPKKRVRVPFLAPHPSIGWLGHVFLLKRHSPHASRRSGGRCPVLRSAGSATQKHEPAFFPQPASQALNIEASPNGKARDFDSLICWFDSSRLCHKSARSYHGNTSAIRPPKTASSTLAPRSTARSRAMSFLSFLSPHRFRTHTEPSKGDAASGRIAFALNRHGLQKGRPSTTEIARYPLC